MAAAGNIEALWAIKYDQSLEVSVQGTAGGGGACVTEAGVPEARAPTLSLLAPELLDCGRCGNGCEGGFVWDAFITVLNISECLSLGAAVCVCVCRGGGGWDVPELSRVSSGALLMSRWPGQ